MFFSFFHFRHSNVPTIGVTEVACAIFYTHQTSGLCQHVCVQSLASNGEDCRKIFVYVGMQIVPMAQTFICNYFLQLQIKLFSVSVNVRKVVITFVETVSLQ